MSQPLRCLVTGSAGAAGAGVSLPRAATFATGGGAAAASACIAGAVSLRTVDAEGFGEVGQVAAAGGGAGSTEGAGGAAATGAAGAGANGGSLLTVEMVVMLAALETTGAGTS